MTRTADMIASHPGEPVLDADLLHEAIDACFACTQACTACADACLSESRLDHLVRCIRLDADCADVCQATGRHLSRQGLHGSATTRMLLEACAEACRVCAEECEQHAADGMEHCRICAEACRTCQQACEQLVASL